MRFVYENGVTTRYAYDAAGRLVKEGDRTDRYGYLDKVLSVAEGGKTYTYSYHADGQLARAGRDVLVPVRPVSRYPSGLGLGGVGRVLLLGDCREWACLVPKGVPVTCAED